MKEKIGVAFLVVFMFSFGLMSAVIVNRGPNLAKNNFNDYSLRSLADFHVKVAEDVYWIPASKLGRPSLESIQQFKTNDNPEYMQSHIRSVYDFIRYIRTINFKDDKKRYTTEENGFIWEHHMPGHIAIKQKTGDCSVLAAAAQYALRDDYEEAGYIQYFKSDGTGHVFNYFKVDDKYYVVDFTHYKNEFKKGTAFENGNMDSYYESDYVLGNIHEVTSLKSYADYIVANFDEPPALIMSYVHNDITDIAFKDNVVHIAYPVGLSSVDILYENKMIYIGTHKGPDIEPQWIQD